MLVPIFSLNLKQKINLKQVCAGRFDGRNNCLAGATSSGKIFIHNPSHIKFDNDSHGDLVMLNINQAVTCLTTANFNQDRDYLIVGTAENLMGFDVFNNLDIFNKEVSDKPTTAVYGEIGHVGSPLVVVGGNCSIQGFDFSGNDSFWTVTGDKVCSLAILDFDGDGRNELLVGSEDYDIRVFKDDEILTEISENEIVNNLLPVTSGRFAYTLMNGTVGVYDSISRTWRIKSKNIPNTLAKFDVNGDGVDELVTGWSNGKIDARDVVTGDTILKESLSNAVAGFIVTDYKGNGQNILLCCCLDGRVEAFSSNPLAVGGIQRTSDQDLFQELSNKKTSLLLELKNYEINKAPSSSPQHSLASIPADTQVHSYLYVTNPEESSEQGTVELQVCTSNDSIIRALVIFAEGIFEGESSSVHLSNDTASNKVQIPLYPQKDVPTDLYIKVFVGSLSSDKLHVFEIMRCLPRFSMYLLVTNRNLPEPEGCVQFQLAERVNRVCLWINQNFLLPEDLNASDNLDVQFVCLRTSMPIQILMNSSGHMTLKTDNIEMAGEIIQQLCSFLNIQHLSSKANFPKQFSQISSLMDTIQEFQSTKQKLSSEMVDNSNMILNLVVRAEDARILGDMISMKHLYNDLLSFNKDLYSYYRMRNNNHKQLTGLIKEIHMIVQNSAKLRYGKFKVNVLNDCKEALKNNDPKMFLNAVQVGSI